MSSWVQYENPCLSCARSLKPNSRLLQTWLPKAHLPRVQQALMTLGRSSPRCPIDLHEIDTKKRTGPVQSSNLCGRFLNWRFLAQNSQTDMHLLNRVCHRFRWQASFRAKPRTSWSCTACTSRLTCVILCDMLYSTFVNPQQHFTWDFAIASLQATIYLKDLHFQHSWRDWTNWIKTRMFVVQAELSGSIVIAWHTDSRAAWLRSCVVWGTPLALVTVNLWAMLRLRGRTFVKD